MIFRLRFPAEHAIYDGLVVNGRPLPLTSDARARPSAPPCQAAKPYRYA